MARKKEIGMKMFVTILHAVAIIVMIFLEMMKISPIIFISLNLPFYILKARLTM